jgi:methyl-accepting chemotaxis protein
MFKTVKAKLISLIIGSLVTLTLILSLTTIYSVHNSILESNFNKLSTANSAKKDEIENYFGYLKGLLTSLASQEGTKDAFVTFEDGFYKLSKEIGLNISEIDSKLKQDLSTNYLDSVNYNVPHSSSRKNIDSYIPKDNNGKIAQYIFITDNKEPLGKKNNMTYNPKYNSTYMNAHKKYHKSFDTVLNAYSLYDIFMADMKGNLIYTDFKEKDYATNLKTGVYANSGIGRAYQKALQLNEGEISFDDFAPYEPSYNAAASFMATPIFINGVKKGVLIFQMPVDIINSIMQFNGKYEKAGLKTSGEAYLVGNDYKMRSNSRFQKDIKDPVVQSLGSTIGVWDVKTDSIKAVFEGQNGKWVIPDYRGVNVLSVYDSVDILGKVQWAIVSEIDEAEALEDLYSLILFLVIPAVIVLTVMLVVSLILVKKAVLTPISNFNEYFQAFLEVVESKRNKIELVEVHLEDEFASMIHSINNAAQIFIKRNQDDMKVVGETTLVMDKLSHGIYQCRINSKTQSQTLARLIAPINNSIDIINKDMHALKSTLESYKSNDYTKRVEISESTKADMLAVLESVNSLGEFLAQSAKQNLYNGNQLEKNSQTMSQSVNNLVNKANQQAASLEETAAAVEEITSITRNNTQNASKMSQLGSQVQGEVKNGMELATKTSTSMDEINVEVTAIREAITVIDQIAFQTNILSLNAAVEAATAGEAGKGFAVVAGEVRNLASRSSDAANEIKLLVESATKKAKEGKDISAEMIHGYEALNKSFNETIVLIEDVSNASKEQMTGIEQINDTVMMIDKMTQENAHETNSVSQIAKEVSNMSNELVVDAQTKKF